LRQMKRVTLISLFLLTVGALYAFPAEKAAQPVAVPAIVTYGNGNSRLGQNLQETILTPSSVNATNFGQLFNWQTDGNIYAQPLYVPNLTINGSVHNVVFVVTEADGIYAFDADSQTLNPTPLWYISLVNGSSVTPVPCLAHKAACTIYPLLGISGTPAINVATNTMYLVARTAEGDASNPNYVERVHAINILTGQEQSYSPYTICSAVYSTGQMGCQLQTGIFNPLADGQRPALLLEPQSGFSQGVLWVGFAGQGMMLAFDASTLAQLADWTATPHPKNTTGGGGIWGSGGGVSGDANSNVYVAVGDGTFDVNVGGNNYGDSIVKLNLVTSSTNSSGWAMQVMDYFTPPDEACRQTTDTDLGSGGPVLLPPQPGDVPNLIYIGGKGNVPQCDSANPVFLVNADDMGGLGGGVQTVGTTAAIGFWSSAAYYSNGATNSLYFGGVINEKPLTGDNLWQWPLSSGLLASSPATQSPETYLSSPTPFISASGNTNAIVWTIMRPEVVDNEKGTNAAILYAYDANNLGSELYNSSMNAARDTAGPAVKFAVPTVVNGKVYVGTQTGLYVYGMCPCIGSAGNATLSPTSLTFATQLVKSSSAAQPVTLTNTASSPISITSIAASGAYSETNNCGTTLAGNASCTINVIYTPTAAGTQTGTLTVTDNAANSPQTATLSGVGTFLSFSPTSLSFGAQALGTSSSPQTVTITNTYSAAVAFTKTSITGTNASSFAIQSSSTCPLGTGSLASGASCTVVVVFDPQASGALSANISVTAAGGGSPHTISMSGTGGVTTGNATLTPSSFTFATQLVKTSSASQPATLTNTGTAAITIGSIVTTGPYSQTNNCGTTLAGNASCTINIVFTPTAAGTQTGSITVTSNAANSPQSATLSGVGTVLTFSPTSLSFGTQSVNTASSPQTVTITNVGTTAVTTSKISVTGSRVASFVIQSSSTCPLSPGSIAAGASCTVVVVFDPTLKGALTANITAIDAGGASPQTVPMSGTGD
jgi:Abnormal spindle-like microcephaly-assoc'd, ASPM-SPD-2-Hydin